MHLLFWKRLHFSHLLCILCPKSPVSSFGFGYIINSQLNSAFHCNAYWWVLVVVMKGFSSVLIDFPLENCYSEHTTHCYVQEDCCFHIHHSENLRSHLCTVEQKSIGLKFSKPQTGSDVWYNCHHNSSHFTFPIFAHSWRFSVFHSLQSITPHIYELKTTIHLLNMKLNFINFPRHEAS